MTPTSVCVELEGTASGRLVIPTFCSLRGGSAVFDIVLVGDEGAGRLAGTIWVLDFCTSATGGDFGGITEVEGAELRLAGMGGACLMRGLGGGTSGE